MENLYLPGIRCLGEDSEDRGTVPDPWGNLGIGFKTCMGKRSRLI